MSDEMSGDMSGTGSENSVLFQTSRDGLAVVTLHRPEVHNAFDDAVIERLSDIFEDLRAADNIRAVLLESTGKSFSAGADVNWMRHVATFDRADNLEDARALGEMLRRLNELPIPTIAVVQGAAYGGGVGLIAACDMAIAVRDAAFGLSEVKLGLVAATISPYVIAAIGARQARRYMLTGERFSAAEAHRMGLVHEVVSDGAALTAAVESLVAKLFAAAPQAVIDSKALIAKVAGEPVTAELIDMTARCIADVRSRDEAREGVSAFLEKRKPSWQS